MKFKIPILLCVFFLIHSIYPADTGPWNARSYISELNSWLSTCKTLFPRCTMLEACALILKHRKLPLEITSSSPAASSNETTDVPLEAYVQCLQQENDAIEKTYLLCKPQDTCALLLEKLDHQTTTKDAQKILKHPNASKSILWPSINNIKSVTEGLQRWHKICLELDPECRFIECCNLILTHQMKTALKNRFERNIQSKCMEALEQSCNFLEMAIETENYKFEEACAYSITFPGITLPLPALQMLSKEPQYVTNYKDFIKELNTAKEANITKMCCNIIAQPQMSHTWQQVASASHSLNLITEMIRHKRYMHCPKEKLALSKGYLLHGYPGVGKSSAAQMFAMLYQRPFVKINCAAIQTKWQASSVENLDKLLAPIIQSNDPWVIVLEELDALQKTKSADSDGRSNALTLLQSWMDESKNPNLIIVGTSNYLKEIPDSVSSRVRIIHVPLPKYNARSVIAQAYLNENEIKYNKNIVHIIAEETGGLIPGTTGLTGREIRLIVNELHLSICDKLYKKHLEGIPPEMPRIATEELTQLAIKKVKGELSAGKKPLTIQGRKWKEFRESPDFWPAVNAGATYTGLVWSFIQGAYGMHMSSQQLDISKQQAENSDAQLLITLFKDKKDKEYTEKTFWGKGVRSVKGDNKVQSNSWWNLPWRWWSLSERTEYTDQENMLHPYINKLAERAATQCMLEKK
ncbi:MAG: AAA family ATPase [Candidatus Dependentiae bacterium]